MRRHCQPVGCSSPCCRSSCRRRGVRSCPSNCGGYRSSFRRDLAKPSSYRSNRSLRRIGFLVRLRAGYDRLLLTTPYAANFAHLRPPMERTVIRVRVAELCSESAHVIFLPFGLIYGRSVSITKRKLGLQRFRTTANTNNMLTTPCMAIGNASPLVFLTNHPAISARTKRCPKCDISL